MPADLTEFLTKLGAPVVLIVLSKVLNLFYLPEVGSWFSGVGFALRYLTALGAAAVAHQIPRKKMKALTFLLPLIIAVGCGLAYQYFVQVPPTESEKTVWEVLRVVTFGLAYFATGFLVAVVVGVLWPKKDQQDQQSPP